MDNMTPKEKAKELVDKMLPPQRFHGAIHCALKAVSEIIDEIKGFGNVNDPYSTSRIEYWREVKEEINKLQS